MYYTETLVVILCSEVIKYKDFLYSRPTQIHIQLIAPSTTNN